ncbi:MAG: cell envelope integrity protein TolA [Gammaproteobacteria bacterium]|nr:cell envelope integrity protein TolA [Gammaproteobacteria bacterium]MDH5272403.1 cell envelope integrity protein TolA [Gammaproteobacteria bacterium]
MGRAASGNLRPWIGSAIVHGLVVVALALAAIQWRTAPPPPQLAIEGSVVRYEDLPSSVKAGKALREPTPVAPVKQVPLPAPTREPEPQPATRPDPAVLEEKTRADVQAKAEARAERRNAEQAQATAALAKRKRAEADEKRRQDEKRQQEAAAAQQRLAEQQAAAREAKVKAARQADLRRALADEEAGEALARSGVVDEYRTLLIQTIERNWNRPPSARAGLECTLYVTQATGGTVLDVKIGDCNGDQAVRESVANAVYRSTPLPAPRDARAFERRLVIVFKPTE